MTHEKELFVTYTNNEGKKVTKRRINGNELYSLMGLVTQDVWHLHSRGLVPLTDENFVYGLTSFMPDDCEMEEKSDLETMSRQEFIASECTLPAEDLLSLVIFYSETGDIYAKMDHKALRPDLRFATDNEGWVFTSAELGQEIKIHYQE